MQGYERVFFKKLNDVGVFGRSAVESFLNGFSEY